MTTNDEDEYYTKREYLKIMLDVAEHHSKAFSLKELMILHRVQEFVETGQDPDMPDWRIESEGKCLDLAYQFAQKVQREVGFTKTAGGFFMKMYNYLLGGDPVSKKDYPRSMIQEVTSLKTIEKRLDILQDQMNSLTEMMTMIYYAPGMPGYEASKESFTTKCTSNVINT